MTGHARDLLPLYALGALDGDDALVVERALAGDARLAAELAAYREVAAALGAVIQPVAPPADVKRRLFASIGFGRFEGFSSRFATLFDVTVDRARELLGQIERPASWVPQIPGISLVHFDGGPAAAAADCGFVMLAPGAIFPPHTHLGEEVVTILSGRLHDVTNDRVIGPGEDYVQPQGSSHTLACVGDSECVYASRAMNGITVGGQRARPTKN